MGMDIYSSTGVVVPLEEAAPAIFRKIKKGQIPAAVEAVHGQWKCADREGLDDVKDLGSLCCWLVEVANRLANKEEGYIDSLALTELFDILCAAFGVELPPFEFDYWTRSRISGWSVPIGTPCVVFGAEGLFETKMTKEGKKLAKALGRSEIETTTWTIMSV